MFTMHCEVHLPLATVIAQLYEVGVVTEEPQAQLSDYP